MANSKVIYSKAKTVAAAIGSTLTALSVALTVVQLALGDGNIDAGEVGTLASAAVTLVGTVYAVWRTENKVLSAAPTERKWDY
jgi:fatty acid/phospholipid biosynthesis enzyme